MTRFFLMFVILHARDDVGVDWEKPVVSADYLKMRKMGKVAWVIIFMAVDFRVIRLWRKEEDWLLLLSCELRRISQRDII